MSIFESVLRHIAVRAEKVDGDYYEGCILYCGKCHTPKETVLQLGDDTPQIIARIACKCMNEAEEERIKQEKTDMRRASIEESIRNLIGLGVARMPKHSFDECDNVGEEIQRRMVKYAENFDEIYDKNIGLILYGNTGVGKTFFAECIADALIKKGRFAWLTSVSGIVNAMAQNYGDNNQYILNYVRNVDLLILDDLGTERDTSYMNEKLFEIIDTRYASKRPILVTTNISPEALMANTSINVRRIGERLLENCVGIEVKGKTRRIEKSKEKISQLKTILGEA